MSRGRPRQRQPSEDPGPGQPILFSIAENPETTARLLPVVNKLVEAVHVSPSWVKQVQVCTQVCQVLTKISNLEQELTQSTLTTGGYSGSKKSSARRDMVSLGIVTNCLEVLKVPTPPAKPKEEGAPDGPPQVSPEVAVKVAALATLHSLLDEPTCVDELRKIKGPSPGSPEPSQSTRSTPKVSRPLILPNHKNAANLQFNLSLSLFLSLNVVS